MDNGDFDEQEELAWPAALASPPPVPKVLCCVGARPTAFDCNRSYIGTFSGYWFVVQIPAGVSQERHSLGEDRGASLYHQTRRIIIIWTKPD